MVRIFRILVVFIAILLFFIAFFIANSSYDELGNRFLATIGRPELVERLHTAFSMQKFAVLRAFALGFSIFFAIIAIFLYKNAAFIINFIKKSYLILIDDVKLFTKKVNEQTISEHIFLGVILIASLIKSLYFAISQPIYYDEAWTYNYFSSQFPLLAAFYYPCPNNHVFYSIISAFFEKIPFIPPVFAIRLPSILANLLAIYVLFGSVKRWFGTEFAWWTSLFFASLFGVITYSWGARGYSLQLLLVCLNLLFFIEILMKITKKMLIYYTITMVLGLYTVPSLLYYWLALFFIFWLVKWLNAYNSVEIPQIEKRSSLDNLKILKQELPFIYANIAIAIGSFLLYLPILLTSNITTAYKNIVYSPNEPFSDAFYHVYHGISIFFTSNNAIISLILHILIVFSVILIIFYEKNYLKRKIIAISVFFITFPFIIFLLQYNDIPSRIFVFCLPFVAIVLAYPFARFKVSRSIGVLFFIAFLVVETPITEKNYDADTATMGEKLVTLQPKTVYTYDEFCKPVILFQFRKKRLPLPNIICSALSKQPANCDYFIIQRDSLARKTSDMGLVLSLQSFSLYQKNN